MAKTRDQLNFAFVQARRDQAIKLHEIICFETSGNLGDDQVKVHDLLEIPVDSSALEGVDALVIGGSGDYSVLDDVPNLDSLKSLVSEAARRGLPIFGCCWGHQLLALLFGGTVIRDSDNREIGTIEVLRTAESSGDLVFSELPERFLAQAAHSDRVSILPMGAVNLAGTAKCPIQAFTFPGTGIYGTQFHPEMSKEDMLIRLEHYGENYVGGSEHAKRIAAGLKATPEAAELIRTWIDKVVLPRAT
jgi:GMP synthase (glutamine-hydrolysing)